MAVVPTGLGAIMGPGAIWPVGQDGPSHRQESIGTQAIADVTDNTTC